MYTSADKINTFLSKSIADADLADVIAAAKDLIDNETGREFGSIADGYDPAQTERYFDGNNLPRIQVDDMVEVLDDYNASLITVEVGTDSNEGPSVFEEEEDFVAEPANANARGVPVTSLFRKGQVWPRGIQNIKITAIFMYSIVPPDDIVFAATALAAGMYLANHTADGPIKQEKIGNYAVTYGLEDEKWQALARVREILNNYRRFAL